MSYMESYKGIAPYGTTDEMSHIVVDEPAILQLSNCILGPGEYTLQFWIKATAALEVAIEASGLYQSLITSTEWTKYVYTFKTSDSPSDTILFNLPAGVYYIYHVKLETGNVATEWTVAPTNAPPPPSNNAVSNFKALYRLSDKYVDKIGCENGRWYIERNTELLTLTGSENWSETGDNTYTISLIKRGGTNEILPVICDKFADVTAINDDTATILSIKVDTSIADSLTAWVAWLNENPTNVLIPTTVNTTILANYLQTSLNNIYVNDDLTINFNDENVYDMTGSILIKPIVFGVINGNMSTLINNGSDDEIGFIYQIHCKGEVVNPAIYLTETNQHIKLAATFKRDDIITIDTRRGRKSVIKTYRGQDANIINSFDNTSKWLQLQSGYNHLIQSADSGAENMESKIIYTNEYEGV